MAGQEPTYYSQHLEYTVFFGILALLLNVFALKKGFFRLRTPTPAPKISLLLPVGAFVLYVTVSLLLTPFFLTLAKKGFHFLSPPSSYPVSLAAWAQLGSLSCNCFLLWRFSVFFNRDDLKKIWKDSSNTSPFADWLFGGMTWFLSFPLVVAVGQLSDMFIYVLFKVETYEQIAVRYLKEALSSPPMFATALLIILVVAPVIEEYLFRGLLQTYLKNLLGAKAAILSGALAFSLFHVSPSQGAGNIPLVASLFFLACFLGFVYEKRKSLFASIGLHMIFNAVSTARIIFSLDFL